MNALGWAFLLMAAVLQVLSLAIRWPLDGWTPASLVLWGVSAGLWVAAVMVGLGE